MQRVKVGMIGLAAVILLIALASTILGSLNRDEPPPATVAGTAQSNVVADMAATNSSAASNEPLAELGVAPAPVNTQTPAEPSADAAGQ